MKQVNGVLIMAFLRNVLIFDVDNNSSCHTDNQKNDFLILDEVLTFGINGSFGSSEEKFSINFSKANTDFCLSLHCNGDTSYLFVNGKELYKFKASNKMLTFPTIFCLGSISNKLVCIDSKEVSLKGNVFDFLVDYNSNDKCSILNILKYLMIKNNL